MMKLRLVIDSAALQLVLVGLTGWLNRRERQIVAYLIEESRPVRGQLEGGRLCRTDTGHIYDEPCVTPSEASQGC